MKKILILLLLFSNYSAWAEWVKVMEVTYETGPVTIYIDTTTIRKDGQMRKIWQLSESKNGPGSVRSRLEYYCKDDQYRFLSFSIFTGKMASGKETLGPNIDFPWTDIAPSTAEEKILRFVCAN